MIHDKVLNISNSGTTATICTSKQVQYSISKWKDYILLGQFLNTIYYYVAILITLYPDKYNKSHTMFTIHNEYCHIDLNIYETSGPESLLKTLDDLAKYIIPYIYGRKDMNYSKCLVNLSITNKEFKNNTDISINYYELLSKLNKMLNDIDNLGSIHTNKDILYSAKSLLRAVYSDFDNIQKLGYVAKAKAIGVKEFYNI